MVPIRQSHITKLRWSLPWLSRYPSDRLRTLFELNAFEKKHVIITVANHFEPAWTKQGGFLDKKTQLQRLREYHARFKREAGTVLDMDGTPFRHTNFYPAEQYERDILEIMADMQAEGFGEVEVHMHHEGDDPDTPENVERTLVTFRDILAERHRCLSRLDGVGKPMYAFVHGNLALANSAGGKFCGVDNEMQILQDTGCYADMTLPSAPDQSQVAVVNQIYECDNPLDEAVPHRSGVRLRVDGGMPTLPVIFTGPLMINWRRRFGPMPFPRIDSGQLAANEPMDEARVRRWVSANVTVDGRPDWVFVKLFCHGFFDYDQSATIGDDARRFFADLVESSAKRSDRIIHFASAREAFNMVMAAVDGKSGNPHEYRNYRLRSIMAEGLSSDAAATS